MTELAIGVDIGGTKMHAAAVDRTGRIVLERIAPTLAQEGGEAVLLRALELTGAVLAEAERLSGARLAGIGIGSAGQIDFATGKVAYAGGTMPGWTGIPLGAAVKERFGLPVWTDNDVNVFAVGEKALGAAREFDHFVCLMLGTGVGGAIMEGGRLVRGAFGGAGELGHLSVNFDGPRCYCGNYGCLELYASGTGIARLAREQAAAETAAAGTDKADGAAGVPEGGSEGPDSHAVIRGWLAGEPWAVRIMDKVVLALGTGISSLVHTFNPQAVIIGGGVAATGEPLMAAIRERVKAQTYPSMGGHLRILPVGLGAGAGVIGAAAQVWVYG